MDRAYALSKVRCVNNGLKSVVSRYFEPMALGIFDFKFTDLFILKRTTTFFADRAPGSKMYNE